MRKLTITIIRTLVFEMDIVVEAEDDVLGKQQAVEVVENHPDNWMAEHGKIILVGVPIVTEVVDKTDWR